MGFRQPITRLSQLVADTITGATIIGGSITGALFRTAASGKRWEITSPSSPSFPDTIVGYTGNVNEGDPGKFAMTSGGRLVGLVLNAPRSATVTNTPGITIYTDPDSVAQAKILLTGADDIELRPNPSGTVTLPGTNNLAGATNVTGTTNVVKGEATGLIIKRASVVVPIAANAVNSAAFVYTFPTGAGIPAFSATPAVTANSTTNSVVAVRVLGRTRLNVSLQVYWSDQGATHSATNINVDLIAIGPE